MKKSKLLLAIATVLFFGLADVKAQQTWTYSPAGTTQPYIFSSLMGNNTTHVGIGAFTTTELPNVIPNSDLHFYTANPTITFQGYAPGSGSAGLAWIGNGGNYNLQTTWTGDETSNRLHTIASNGFGTHQSGSNMIFGIDPSGPGVTALGAFTFNGGVGACSLALSPAISAAPGGSTLFALPAGDLFGVNGNSYLGGATTIGATGSASNNLTVNGTANYTAPNPLLTFTPSSAAGTIGNSGLAWTGTGGNYALQTSWVQNAATNRLHMIASSNSFGTHLSPSNIVFGNDIAGNGVTMLGNFTFNGEVGTPALAVSPYLSAGPGSSLWNLPTGYIFGVNGNSYLDGNVIVPALNNSGTINTFTVGGASYFTGVSTFASATIGAPKSTTNNLTVNGGATISGGQVGIGMVPCSTSTGLLQVNGEIEATSIVVENLQGGCFPDYVFAKDYKLKSLNEVEKYVSENSHLPGIPSAIEVEKNGLNLAEMDIKLLEKIEELTLYMIEMKKENEKMKSENQQMKMDIEHLKKAK